MFTNTESNNIEDYKIETRMPNNWKQLVLDVLDKIKPISDRYNYLDLEILKFVSVSESKYNNIVDYIEDLTKKNSTYNLATNNCIHFVNHCLKFLELEMKDLFTLKELRSFMVSEDFIREIYPEIFNKYHNVHFNLGD